MEKYIFNPEEFGYEPVDKFPELGYLFPMKTGKWFIKITEYGNYGRLVYWYHAIFLCVYIWHDPNIVIYSSSFDSERPLHHKKQNKLIRIYSGLISNKYFAIELLKHLLGTTQNESVEKEGKERLYDNKGERMRIEFDYPLFKA